MNSKARNKHLYPMKKLFPIIILLCSLSIQSQTDEWRYYSKDAPIYAITGEANLIWAGTYAGALSYNKTNGEIIQYNGLNSPVEGWISSIAIDGNGNKWMGSYNKGHLYKYDDSEWAVFNTTNSPLPGSPILKLDIDLNDNIWICTFNALFKFDGYEWEVIDSSNSGLPEGNIEDIKCDGNNIWILQDRKLILFDGGSWVTYDESNSNISGKWNYSMEIDLEGNIWIVHSGGIEKFDGDTFTLYDDSNTNIPNNLIGTLAVDSENTIWATCGNYNFFPEVLGGLMSFDGSEWNIYDTTNSAMMDISTSIIYIDSEDAVYFGCSKKCFVGTKNGNDWSSFDPSTAGNDNGHVRQIVHDSEGNAFIGTYAPANIDFGLYRFDMYNWEGIPNYTETTYCMTMDGADNLYVKNRQGVKKYNGTEWSDLPDCPELYEYGEVEFTLYSMNTDIEGELWMDYMYMLETIWHPSGYYTYILHEGLAHFNGSSWDTFTPENSVLPDTEINEIHTDQEGNVWIGTSDGLLKYDGYTLEIFNESNSNLPNTCVSSFDIDSEGNIWLPDGNFGFYQFDGANTIHHVNPELGQFSSGDNEVVMDVDGSVWLRTLFRITNFDGNNWTSFHSDDSPLIYANLTSLSVDGFGNKWIGTKYGFFIYKKDGIITSLDDYEKESTAVVSVFPNPFIGSFEIDPGIHPSNVDVFDLNGRLIYSSPSVMEGNIRIPGNYLSSGVYVFKVVSCNHVVGSGKIIAE
ncbi:MAG: hypothetical protein C0593_13490 [Marinilabiliales bacterium]|nr:MAG: hypothetical protein C0593_13490 [Marinilabiliales bacterium]